MRSSPPRILQRNNSNNVIFSYDAFQTQFAANFGAPWYDGWNTPQPIALDGHIQELADLSAYDALIIPGGTRRRPTATMAAMPTLAPPAI
ncbi:MAG: hypothetical protein R3E79_15385 [Caldilineaceae bacterium]